jgi:hypothetical protein
MLDESAIDKLQVWTIAGIEILVGPKFGASCPWPSVSDYRRSDLIQRCRDGKWRLGS